MRWLANKNLFFGLFSILLLLTFLLAETYVGYYVLGAFSLLLLLFRRAFPLKKTISLPLVSLTLLLWLFMIFSLLGSVSFPLSFYSVIRYTFLMAFLLFFLLTEFSEEEKKMLLQLLLFQGISLAFVSLLFFLIPEYGSRVPGMNVIFSTYGHNHLGAIMLVLSPIAFWFYLTEKKLAYFLIFILFAAAMVMSFGRVVIFVGLAELALLAYTYAKQHRVSWRSPIGAALIGLCVLFAVGLGWYVYSGQNDVCLVEDAEYQNQVCKTDLRKNVRHFYWQQAWDAWLSKPFFGYGIGTFSLISYQFRQIPEFHSSYAHNDYLQLFAEGGVLVGGLFTVWLIWLYRESWSGSFSSWRRLIWLGLAAFGIDIFFDFDWHFFGIALLIMLVFALLIDQPSKKAEFEANKLRPIVTMMLVGVLLVSGLYGIVDFLISNNQEKKVAQVFPFFHWHALNLMKSNQLEPEQKKNLADVYWASPIVQTYWLANQEESDSKAQAEYRLWQVDPWRRLSSGLTEYYFKKSDEKNLEKTLLDTNQFLANKRENLGYYKESIPTTAKDKWAEQFIFLAGKKFEQGQYSTAAQYLINAHYFNEWSLSRPLEFLATVRQESFNDNWGEFLMPLKTIPVEHFGDNRDNLAWLYLQQAKTLSNSNGNDQLIYESTIQALKLAEWNVGWFQQEIFTNPGIFEDLIEEENWSKFYRISLIFLAVQAHQFQDDQYFDYQTYEVLTTDFSSVLQKFIDYAISHGEKGKAVYLLELAGRIDKSFLWYWLQAQRGYLYGYLNDWPKAKTAFEECLTLNSNHEDCRHGLENIVGHGGPDIGRYEEIRQILLAL